MQRALSAAVIAIVASLALTGSALAKSVGGTSGGDTLRGTAASDSIAARGGKSAKKRAVIAVARKLAVTLLALWKSGADYEALPVAA